MPTTTTNDDAADTVLARSGDASVARRGDSEWTVASGGAALALRWEPGLGLSCQSFGRAGAPPWRPAVDHLFALAWDGRVLTGRDLGRPEARAAADGQAVSLTLSAATEAGLAVELELRCVAGHPFVERRLTIAALRPGALTDAAPLAWRAAAPSGPATAAWVEGPQGQGGPPGPDGPYRAFRLREEPLGELKIESGPRSSWLAFPWLALRDSSGEGMLVNLFYSGRWSIAADGDGALVGLRASADLGRVELAAGERRALPPVATGLFRGDLDDAAAAQHAFHRAAIAPPTPEDFPWVTYNTWFAYLTDIDEASLLAEVGHAAEIGCELFVIDAGWWDGARRRDARFSTALGMWRPDPRRFPGGLGAVADAARARGMRFGLWVEPERVDLRMAAEAGWDPAWLAAAGGRFHITEWAKDTDAGLLCLGCAAAREWALEKVAAQIEALGVDYLKVDSNWWGVCDVASHGHGAGDGEPAQLDGLHWLLESLRARFPALVIENCAGGATRLDFAMARRTQIAWLSDASEPAQRVRHHLFGASYMFPPEANSAWVAESPREDLSDSRIGRAALDAIFRSRAIGAPGFSARLGAWPAETRAAARDAVAEYKALRPLLREGRLFHLTPQPPVTAPDLDPAPAWDAYQLADPQDGAGVILAFRSTSVEPSVTLRPRGLRPAGRYRVAGEGVAAQSAAGAELMARGVVCAVRPHESAWVTIALEP